MNDVNFLFMRSSTSFSIASSLNHVLSSVIYMYIYWFIGIHTLLLCVTRGHGYHSPSRVWRLMRQADSLTGRRVLGESRTSTSTARGHIY